MISRSNRSRTFIGFAIFVATAVFAFAGVASAQVSDMLHAFVVDGIRPLAPLIQATDGNFYGTTAGSVFKMTPAGSVTALHMFAGGATDGWYSSAALIKAIDGNFYGTTRQGGPSDFGTVFKMTPAGTLSVLHAFTGGATDGAKPYAALIQATDGNFYGTTEQGGPSGLGTVFKMTPAGIVTVLHGFGGGATDGAKPHTSLIQATDGNFYGTTFKGGASDIGSVFKMSPTGAVTILHAFNFFDGRYPEGALIEATDGDFYGTTWLSGPNGGGTVFKITPAGAMTILHSFSTNAGGPAAALIQATDGNFYGTTQSGGIRHYGTVFSMTSAGMVTVLHNFTSGVVGAGPIDGANPSAALVEGTDGGFYGTTEAGGINNNGTAFRVDRNPCRDTLTLAYAAGTLNLGFTLRSNEPTTWTTAAVSSAGSAGLWSVPIPAMSPAASFTLPIPVPPIGNLAIVTALSTPAKGVMCFDWKLVNTGP